MAGFEYEDDNDPYAENDLMASELDDDDCLILDEGGSAFDEEELAFEEISSDAPVSALDMLGRLDSASELLAEEDEQPAPPPPPAPPEAHGSDENDDDIGEYMASLMQRSNGFSSAAAAEKPKKQKGAPRKEPEVPESSRWDQRNERRKKARESDPEDLSGMRELANMNARSALDTHSHQVMIRDVYATMGIAMTGISVSIALLFLSDGVGVVFFLSLVSMLAGTAWTVKCLRGAARLKRLTAAEVAEEAAKQAAKAAAESDEPAEPADSTVPAEVV